MRYALALTLAPVLYLTACGGGDDLTGPDTGTLEVTTSTSGSPFDPDGYSFQIDGGPANPIGLAASVRLEVPAGSHSILLTGLTDDCSVTDNPRSVTIVSGQTTTAVFAIACNTPSPGTGTIQVFTATTGLDPDPDGYTFSVDGGAGQVIGTNANVAVASAIGAHTVELSGVAGNCTVNAPNPRPVTVTAGAPAEVRFTITCGAANSALVWRHMDTGTDYILTGIWGSSPSDLFTVGETSGGDPTSGILHFDGQSWTEQLTEPNQRLQGIWGSGPADVFAVGFNSISAGPGGLIYHYDGSTWTEMQGPSIDDPFYDDPFYSNVWGSSGSDVYAVGEYFEGRDKILISHFNGTAWTQDPFNSGGIAWDVYGTSANNVYVAGHGFVLRYDGLSWTTTGFKGGSAFGVWASSPNDVYAVGWDEDGGFISHYDGQVWRPMELPTMPIQLLDVWGSSSSDVYAVGAGTILHYDGTHWTQVSEEGGNRVFGLSATDVYVVGSNGSVLHGTP